MYTISYRPITTLLLEIEFVVPAAVIQLVLSGVHVTRRQDSARARRVSLVVSVINVEADMPRSKQLDVKVSEKVFILNIDCNDITYNVNIRNTGKSSCLD
jgi:uncharacterized membrane protein